MAALLDTGIPLSPTLARVMAIITQGGFPAKTDAWSARMRGSGRDHRSVMALHPEAEQPAAVVLRVDAAFAAGDLELLLRRFHSGQVGEQQSLATVGVCTMSP
jgi:hypothetical protein